MEWRDQGLLLSTRRHGESAAIIDVFTQNHGRHAGIVRGGSGRRMAPILQPGAHLDLTWKARLEDHLGSFSVEPIRSRTDVMSKPLALSGLNAVLALLSFSFPEREPHPEVYSRSSNLLDLLGDLDLWPLGYLRWELFILETLGFALDLNSCAVTGSSDQLAYISPKSGRAVSKKGAGAWANRLLEMPDVLLGQGDFSTRELLKGFDVTGYFLEKRVASDLAHSPLPDARARFLDRLSRL